MNNNNLESINGLNSNVRMQVLHAEVSWPMSVNAIHPWPSVVVTNCSLEVQTHRLHAMSCCTLAHAFCKHVSDSTQAAMTDDIFLPCHIHKCMDVRCCGPCKAVNMTPDLLQNNRICSLKGSLSHFKFLDTLDLSNNQLRNLPKLAAHLAKLLFLSFLNLKVTAPGLRPILFMTVSFTHGGTVIPVLTTFVHDDVVVTLTRSIAHELTKLYDGFRATPAARSQTTASLSSMLCPPCKSWTCTRYTPPPPAPTLTLAWYPVMPSCSCGL